MQDSTELLGPINKTKVEIFFMYHRIHLKREHYWGFAGGGGGSEMWPGCYDCINEE